MRWSEVRRNFLLLILLIFPTAFVAAATSSTPPIIFSEVKVRNDSAGFNEFIELYNTTGDQVSLNDYTIDYFNVTNPTSGQTPTGEAVIDSNLLEAGNYFVLAKDASQIPNAKTSPFISLADSGGRLRLIDSTGQVIDELAWTSTSSQAIAPIVLVTSASSTKSLSRGVDSSGIPVAGTTAWGLVTPSPQSSVLIEPPADPEPDPEPPADPTPPADDPTPPVDDGTPDPAGNGGNTPTANLPPLQLSELLPNPGSPITDEEGEYVELYNPNAEPVDLNGYKLQTGSNYTYSFTFTAESIAPNSYKAFYSSGTNLVLANSTGRARLLDPNGQVVSETDTYDSADDDTAWALINGTWQWTITPTPNAANVLTIDTPITKAAKAAKTSTKKASTSTTKPKTSTAKTAAAKTTKKTAATTTDVADDSSQVTPLHPAVLAGVGGAALLYGAYEYRQDASNLIYRFKRYRTTRRAGRG